MRPPRASDRRPEVPVRCAPTRTNDRTEHHEMRPQPASRTCLSGTLPRLFSGTAVAAVLVITSACQEDTDAPTQTDLRMNQIQVVGSHNSYKKAMRGEIMEQLRAIDPATADSLDYEHSPLEDQLDRGLRNLELDVFWDPEGTRYGWPEGEQPTAGMRVLHVQNLDDQSHCSTLGRCLDALRAWSTDHPGHLPIAVTVNAKDQVIDREGFTRPLSFDETAWQHLDAVLRQKLGDRLLEPAAVFPQTTGAERAVARPTWPPLDTVRGHFLFVLDEGGSKRADYAARWHERAMFTNTPPGEPGAAVLILNDPIEQHAEIQQRVREGFMVRTRADADTREARSGATDRRDAAFASGAHWVTTDYDQPAKFGTGYAVELPGGGVGRCNPVLHPEEAACDALRARDDN